MFSRFYTTDTEYDEKLIFLSKMSSDSPSKLCNCFLFHLLCLFLSLQVTTRVLDVFAEVESWHNLPQQDLVYVDCRSRWIPPNDGSMQIVFSVPTGDVSHLFDGRGVRGACKRNQTPQEKTKGRVRTGSAQVIYQERRTFHMENPRQSHLWREGIATTHAIQLVFATFWYGRDVPSSALTH